MYAVNMFEAKSTLSQLVDKIERGIENEIIIARHGKPAARLVPIVETPSPTKRIGVAVGITIPDDIDTIYYDEIESLFFGHK